MLNGISNTVQLMCSSSSPCFIGHDCFTQVHCFCPAQKQTTECTTPPCTCSLNAFGTHVEICNCISHTCQQHALTVVQILRHSSPSSTHISSACTASDKQQQLTSGAPDVDPETVPCRRLVQHNHQRTTPQLQQPGVPSTPPSLQPSPPSAASPPMGSCNFWNTCSKPSRSAMPRDHTNTWLHQPVPWST